jgi:single-stranded DNA-binding protein
MISLNEVTILGRAGNTPKLYNLAMNKKFATIPVYINTKSNDNENSVLVECEAWGDLAVILGRLNIVKGQELIIKGKLRNRKNSKTNSNELCVVINDLRIFPLKQKFSTEGGSEDGSKN